MAGILQPRRDLSIFILCNLRIPTASAPLAQSGVSRIGRGRTGLGELICETDMRHHAIALAERGKNK
jgi:hypothetical protein